LVNYQYIIWHSTLLKLAQNIAVKVSGHDATLTGKVDSLHQKKEAERMAWNAPGVSAVHNELVVEYK
jgi:osmotically-inducible protein OsmY